MLLQLASTIAASWRWSLIMKNMQFSESIVFYIRTNFLGAFFNQLLPTSVGGDAVRAIVLSRRGYKKWRSVGAILIDRVYGVIGILLINLIAFASIYHYFPKTLAWLVIAITIIGLVMPLTLSAGMAIAPTASLAFLNVMPTLYIWPIMMALPVTLKAAIAKKPGLWMLPAASNAKPTFIAVSLAIVEMISQAQVFGIYGCIKFKKFKRYSFQVRIRLIFQPPV